MNQTAQINVNTIQISNLNKKETGTYTMEDFSNMSPDLVVYFCNRKTMLFAGPHGLGYSWRCKVSDINEEFLSHVNAFDSWVVDVVSFV